MYILIVGKGCARITSLTNNFAKSFAMKDLGPNKQILGMSICCDRGARKLWASQEKYMEKVLEQLYMNNAKPMNLPLGSHFKLTKNDLSENEKE